MSSAIIEYYFDYSPLFSFFLRYPRFTNFTRYETLMLPNTCPTL